LKFASAPSPWKPAAATVDARALQEAFARLDDELADDSALTEATEDALAAAARTGLAQAAATAPE
jgi:hypothetical protein